MAEYSVPKSSPYYYGEDSTYKPRSVRKKSAPKPRAEFELDAQGLPVRVNPVASSQTPGKSSGNVVRIGGKEYSEEEFNKEFGSTRELALAEQERLGRTGKGADIRGGGGMKPDGSRFVTKPDGSVGTQTGPSQAKPADMGAFMNKLQSKYGIKFNFNEQDRNGYQSNALPGTNSAMGPVADGDAYGAMLEGTKGTTGIGPYADGDLYGRALEGRTGGETAVGAQSGTSPSADVGDQSRALKIPRGERQQEMFFRQNPNYGVDTADSTPKSGGGLSARSRAFLDYDGPGGSMMALRAAEAAQGTIKQNGKLYGMSEDGTATEINSAGADILKRDGNAIASQQFLNDYKYVPGSPSETESADVMKPEPVSQREPNSNFGPVADTEQYGKMLDATRGMSGMGPVADGEAYGLFLDGREPMMRQK